MRQKRVNIFSIYETRRNTACWRVCLPFHFATLYRIDPKPGRRDEEREKRQDKHARYSRGQCAAAHDHESNFHTHTMYV